MPAYLDYTVPVPLGKNITQKRINGSVYIYFTYSREKTAKGNLSPKNSSIGKLKPDSNPPVMYPNLNYFKHFGSAIPDAPRTAIGPAKNEINSRTDIFFRALDLIMDSYRELIQEMREAGEDVTEFKKELYNHLDPEWKLLLESK